MCRGSAADPGSTPGPGPFAACHSLSLTLFPVKLFICTINKARKRPKKKELNVCSAPAECDDSAAAAGSHFSNLSTTVHWAAIKSGSDIHDHLHSWWLCFVFGATAPSRTVDSRSYVHFQFLSSWFTSKWTWNYWMFTNSRTDKSASLFPVNKPRGSKVTVNPPLCSPVGDFRLHQQIEDDGQQVVGTHRLDTDCRGRHNTGNRITHAVLTLRDTMPLSKPND